MESERERMNAHFQRVMAGLRLNAERDLRLSRRGDAAKAQARLHTLEAAEEVYAAAHLSAYGMRPWPRPSGTGLSAGRP